MSKTKLFCFPYAGGSAASIYTKWKRLFNNSIEVYPIELAGRGRRYCDPFYNNMEEVVEDVYSIIKNEIETTDDYVFFGHSFGSIISYELTHKIMEENLKKPKHIFFSGNRAPHRREPKNIHHLPDDEFLQEIISLGGTPEELLREKELLDLYLPLLRADFKVNDTYSYVKREAKLDCDITVINGRQDDMSITDITEWNLHTSENCKFFMMDGGHFFINDKTEDIIKIINHTLEVE